MSFSDIFIFGWFSFVPDDFLVVSESFGQVLFIGIGIIFFFGLVFLQFLVVLFFLMGAFDFVFF